MAFDSDDINAMDAEVDEMFGDMSDSDSDEEENQRDRVLRKETILTSL